MIDELHSEISNLNDQVKCLQKELNEKNKMLGDLRNRESIIKKLLGKKVNDSIKVEFILGCKRRSDDIDTWSNIIVSDSFDNSGEKVSLDYPESIDFNYELRDLLLRFIRGKGYNEDESRYLLSNDNSEKAFNELLDKYENLNIKYMCIKDQVSEFIELPWYKKIFYRFKL